MRHTEKIALTDGRIHTPAGITDSVVIEAGRLSAVGTLSGARISDDTRVIALEGRTVLPGFSDSRAHIMRWAMSHERIRLEDCRSMDDILSTLSDFAEMHPDPVGGWYQGYGWETEFTGGSEPTRHMLDTAIRGTPVILWRRGGHIAAVNTAALEAAGITRDTRVEAGDVQLGPDGTPTGILREAAADLAEHCIQPLGDSEMSRVLRTYATRAASCGLTEVSTDDLSSFGGNFHRMINFFMNAAASDDLPFRVRLQFRVTCAEEMLALLSTGWRSGDGVPMCRIGPVKIVCDGSIGGRTAYLRDGRSSRGIALMDQETLDELVLTAHMAGMQTALQADGDAALDMCLTALERAYSRRLMNTRDIIISTGMADDFQLERMRRLRVGAAVRPFFTQADMIAAQNLLGVDRANQCSRWRSMMARGIVVSSGSDAPDGAISPLDGINSAVTRIPALGGAESVWNASERLTPAEAAVTYSWNAAWNGRSEARRGEIAVGRDADLVILNGDPFSSGDITEIGADMTICGGRVTYSSGKLA